MIARNIIFFGESGHGKSSVINMVLGSDHAPTSSSAMGCTFQSNRYPHEVLGHNLVLWDTAGLNEGDQGTVTDTEAVASLYRLLQDLEDGVSLLVFCIRAPRINPAAHKNWILFREIICQKKVPIVMVVTHLENEESMDGWWLQNENSFRKYGMNPCSEHGSGVACITASKGRLRRGRHAFQDEYEESQEKIRQLIVDNHLRIPYRVRAVEWFQTIAFTYTKTGWCWQVEEVTEERQERGRGIYDLASRWNISLDEAEKVARILQGQPN
jgi:tRNA U34 5-carboxymethylaminomethyl modifying GTPase MnmE/TrmE